MIAQRIPVLQGGPDAYLDFDFRFGQEAYWINRQRYGDFTLVSGATSTGGAGFGMVQRNGVWQSVPANAPLIGDGGLSVPESRQQLYGYAGNLAASAATFSVLGTSVTKGGPDIQGGNGGARMNLLVGSANKLCTPGGGADAVTYVNGATYTLETWVYLPTTTYRYVQLTGLVSIFGTGQYVNVDLQTLAINAVGGTASVTAFGPWVRICFAVVATVGGVANAGVLAAVNDLSSVRTATTTATGVVDFAACQVKVGPNINDPPILQTSGLAATRTAVDQSVGGLTLPSGDWTISGSVQMLGDTGTTQRFIDWNDGADDNKISVERTSTGSVLVTSRRAASSTTVAAFNSKGGARTIEWSVRKIGGSLIATCDGVEASPAATTAPSGLNAVQLGAFRAGSGGWLNGNLRQVRLRYG